MADHPRRLSGTKGGAIPIDSIDWGAIFATRVRAQEVLLEAQETRWWAAQVRQQARLLRLARSMPGANGLTLTVTAKLLAQRGLLAKHTIWVPARVASVRPHSP